MQGVIMHETHNAHDEHDEMQHDARMNATNKTNHTTNLGIQGRHLERRFRGVTSSEEETTFCVRGSTATEASPGLLGLLFGLLLRRLIWRRDQHLHQKWAGRFFWQRSRTVDLPRLLRPALGN